MNNQTAWCPVHGYGFCGRDNQQFRTAPAGVDTPLNITPGIPPFDPTLFILPSALDYIQTIDDAVTVVKYAIWAFRAGYRYSNLEEDYIMLFAEEAINRVASRQIEDNNILINADDLYNLQISALHTHAAIRDTFVENAFTEFRVPRAGVVLQTHHQNNLRISIDSSFASLRVNNITIRTPEYEIILSRDFITTNTPIEIRVDLVHPFSLSEGPAYSYVTSVANLSGNVPIAGFGQNTTPIILDVSFNQAITTPIGLTLKPVEGNTDMQTIMDSNNRANGGNPNPVTGKLETKIMASNRYRVQTNLVNFSDIVRLTAMEQHAIRTLASKGIVGGTGGTTFSPDSPITRKEIAALFSRVLGIPEQSAVGFIDVLHGDWFNGAVGAVSRRGLMQGMGHDRFVPHLNTPKEQIAALSGRVLREEMQYANPINPQFILTFSFVDAADIPSWGINDIALATRENLVIPRTDRMFMPDSVLTRAEVAVIFYRLFPKIR